MKKYDRIFKNIIKGLFNRRMLPVLLCVAGIIVVFILVSSMGGDDKQTRPEDTALYDQPRILVGVVPSDPKMLSVDSSGLATGYECELISTVLREYYPQIPVEFIEIESQLASYQLRNGHIDLAIGSFAKSITKTQGLSQSVPYFTDGLYAYVPQESSLSTLSELQGHKVYLMSTEFPASTANKAFSSMGLEIETVSCSSYPDACAALENGTAAAIISPSVKMSGRESLSLRQIDQRIADVSYHVLAWTDNADVTTLINSKLNSMLDDGSLEALRAKYGFGAKEKKKK